MKFNMKKIGWWSVYPLVLGFLWFHFFYAFDTKKILVLGQKISFLDFISVIGLLGVFYLMQIIRSFVLLKTYNKELRFRDAAITSLISSAANTLFIVNVGDFLRIKYFSKYLKVPTGFTFGVLLFGFFNFLICISGLVLISSINIFLTFKNSRFNSSFHKMDLELAVSFIVLFSTLILIWFLKRLHYKYSQKKKEGFGFQILNAIDKTFRFKVVCLVLITYGIQFIVFNHYIPYVSKYAGYEELLNVDQRSTHHEQFCLLLNNSIDTLLMSCIIVFIRQNGLILLGLILAFRYKKFFRCDTGLVE